MADFAATIKVEGARELAARLRRGGDKDLQRAVRRAHKATAEVVAARARQKVPARTGKLRTTIRPQSTLRSAAVKAGGKRAPYAAAIHWGRKWGNVGSPPGNYKGDNPVERNPFLWNAGNEVINVARAVYEREMASALRSARG